MHRGDPARCAPLDQPRLNFGQGHFGLFGDQFPIEAGALRFCLIGNHRRTSWPRPDRHGLLPPAVRALYTGPKAAADK
jgi:hypothetical protein